MAALKKLLTYLIVVLAILAVVPLVIPYDHFKPRIEKAMHDRLQSDVAIESISFSYSPKPQLVLANITLGQHGEGTVGQATIPLTLRNLLYINHELTDIMLSTVQLRQDFAISLPSRLRPNPGHRDLQFATLKFENANVILHKGAFGPMFGNVKFKDDGTIKEINIADKDDRAEINIRPQNDKFALDFAAKNWTLPGAYEARFDQLVLRGVADQNGIDIDEVNGLIFGAAAVGQAQLSWQDGWKLSGTLETKSMQAEPLCGLVSENTRATGRLAATAKFQFAAADYENLFKQPNISANVIINDGELHNLDLIEPLKSQDPTRLRRGGQTRFDTLSGVFTTDGTTASITNINLNGGKFTTTGSLAIDANHQLSGHLNTRLSSGPIVVDAPLTVSGTLNSPELRTGGAYKPGGSSGTTQIN